MTNHTRPARSPQAFPLRGPRGDRCPHIPAALAATYPLRCFAPQWARFDNRPTSRGGFKRRGPKPPPLSLQGVRILKERGKFEIPLSLSGVLWLLSFDTKRKQLAPAGAKSSLLPRSGVKIPHSIPQFPFSVKFSRFPFPVTEKMCKISIKRLDKLCSRAII